MPFVDLATAWGLFADTAFPTLAPKTCSEYRGMWLAVKRGLPAEPTAVEVAAWYRGLLSRYSAGYANAVLCVLRQVARAAAELGGDPRLLAAVARVRSARLPVRPARCPPPDFYARALAACETPVDRCVLGLACLCGLRLGEILGLQPEDWDAAAGVLRVVRQRHRPCRKNRRPHAAAVGKHAELRADLEWTVQHGGDAQTRQARMAGLGGRWLIPWGRDAAMLLWRRIRSTVPPGYLHPGWGWHVCRHWGAQALADAGASVWEILRWLGDSDPAMAQVYVDAKRGAPAPVGCARADGGDRRREPVSSTTTTLGGVAFIWR